MPVMLPALIAALFFFNDPGTTGIYTLSLHDALPIFRDFIGIRVNRAKKSGMVNITSSVNSRERSGINTTGYIDRKSGSAGMPRPISYAVFCLKKKKKKKKEAKHRNNQRDP